MRNTASIVCPQPPHKPPPNNALGAAMAALRTDEEFNDFIKSSAVGTAVVEFGSSWCAKCHEIFPAFYTLARQYPGHSFALAQVRTSLGLCTV